MKTTLYSVAATLALVLAVQAAEVSVKLSKVHLCCQGCVNAAKEAIGKVDGANAKIDQKEGTVTLTGENAATVQKAADALVAAGYFGVSSDPSIKIKDTYGAKGTKVQSLEISGVHLCCPKCVSAVDKAVKSVDGAKAHTAVKNAKTFEVTGDFNDKELCAALEKAGLAGKIGK